MKLVISQLKDGENPLNFSSQNDSWLKEMGTDLAQEGYQLKGGFQAALILHKHEPDYYLQGNLNFGVERECSRCAESFTLPITGPFNLALVHLSSDKKQKATEVLSTESEELDVIYFDGHEIDLKPIIHEQFVLSIPYNSFCKESCRGICQHCGTNLNHGECVCVNNSKLTPFSVLKNLTL
ncbi:MAG: DUF177 domain-containing protein [Proteobacteria bacterium]|nr:DUF177 domain-containing protein [Pseudomonadota bacterium]NDC22930.1 DUF177 domain-containing protein [Pseudomonadota bacterium]NDD03265.1 DUF177 domain-containing protein [Pseudomonadota bacterium]NDG25657.1 DUF177 domain-containing protein [Pseudomonadota bacterium]